MKINKKFCKFVTITSTFISSFFVIIPISFKYDFLWTTLQTEYKQVINWNDKDFIKKLIVDKQGIVYSDFTKTEIIAILPDSKITELLIPKSVIKITGYLDSTPLVGNESLNNPILKGAFEANEHIQSVIFLGDDTNYIGTKSFSNMKNLVSVKLSKNLKKINNKAFYNCTNLREINLNNVEFLGTSAFENTFQNTYNPENSVSRVELDNLEYLGDNAFKETTELNEVFFQKNTQLQFIGRSVFENSGISNIVDISNTNVDRIDNFAFKNSMLKGIITPKTLKILGEGCFEESKIKNVNFSKSKINEFPIWLFKNCKLLEWVILPNEGLEKMGIEVFYNCKLLKTLGTEKDLNISWKSDTNYSFNSIEEKIVLPNTISSIDTSIFRNTGVIHADLSKSKIKETPYNIFLDCVNLKSVYLPSTIENIKNKGFNNNPLLTDVNFPELENLQTIGAGNFVNCKLETIDLSHNLKLTNINRNNTDEPAFSNIIDLSIVKLPNSIKTVILNDMFTRKNLSNPEKPIMIYNIGYYNSNGELSVIDKVLNVSQTATNLGYDRMKTVNLSEMKKLIKVVGKTFANNEYLSDLTLPSKAINWEFLPSSSNYADAPFSNNINLQKIVFKNFNKNSGDDYTVTGEGFSGIGTQTKNQITNILNSFSLVKSNDKNKIVNLQKWQNVDGIIDTDDTASTVFKNWNLESPSNNENSSQNENIKNKTLKSISIDENTTIAYKKHNNVLWTYKSENGGISIEGIVNLYRSNKGNNNYEDKQIYFDEKNINHQILVVFEIIPQRQNFKK